MHWFCRKCFLKSTSGYRRVVNSDLQKRWRLPFCPDSADSCWPTSYWPSSWLVGVGSEGRFQPRAPLLGVCADLNSSEAQRERDLKTLLLLPNGHLRPGHAHSDPTYREVSARFASIRDTVTWSPGGQEWRFYFSCSCHAYNINNN